MAKAKNPESSSPTNQLTQFLKSRKDEHYNFEETTYYEFSQGSLLLDLHVGKLCPGIIRHVGISRGGKTSQMLENVSQFLKAVPDGRALWVLAEGRLGKKTKERSGLKFVYNPDEWEDGTVFVLESNVFDLVFDLIRDLLKNNQEKKKYFFVIDSTNGLKTKADLDKPSSEAPKVAGGAVITSDFLSRVTLGMTKFGHICGLIGQIREAPKIDKYAKGPERLSNASGGNAQDHYPTIFLQFERRYKDDWIGDPKNPVGHWCKVTVLKTDNEKTTQVKYPIKYDSDGKGGSIWVEYEIADLLIEWEYVKKAGSWLTFDEEIINELFNQKLIETNELFKLQGIDNLRSWLEDNKKITEFLFKKFETLLS